MYQLYSWNSILIEACIIKYWTQQNITIVEIAYEYAGTRFTAYFYHIIYFLYNLGFIYDTFSNPWTNGYN